MLYSTGTWPTASSGLVEFVESFSTISKLTTEISVKEKTGWAEHCRPRLGCNRQRSRESAPPDIVSPSPFHLQNRLVLVSTSVWVQVK